MALKKANLLKMFLRISSGSAPLITHYQRRGSTVSYSPHLLKILGIDLAVKVIDQKQSPEQRLFQAIVLQAFEDAMTTHGSKQESYLKKDAHDWFLDNNKMFQSICWYAGFDPDIIHDRYKKMLKEEKIIFTELQKSWVKYRSLYRDYRAAGTPSERREIMFKIVRVKTK